MSRCAIIAVLGSQSLPPFLATPLLGGFSPAELALHSLRNAAPDRFMLLTDHPNSEARVFASAFGLQVVTALPETEELLLLPVETPFVHPSTLHQLQRSVEAEGCSCAASFNGQVGGPLLLRKSLVEGSIDLEALFQKAEHIPVNDASITLNTRAPEGVQALAEHVRRRGPLAQDICEEFYKEAGLACHIRAHCRAVGTLAAEMATKLVQQGACLDIALCRSGGALHDLCRLEPEHSAAGADFLQQRGYNAIADIVRLHDGYSHTESPQLDESGIVCLADKLVQDRLRVTLETRYRSVTDRFPADTAIGQHIRLNMAKCRQLLERYCRLTGDDLEQQCRCHGSLF